MKKILDPATISMLFDTEDSKMIEQIYTEFTGGITNIIDAKLKGFLRDAKFSDEQISGYFAENDAPKDVAMTAILNDELNVMEVEKAVDQYVKFFYDALYPKLSTEKQRELDQYLNDMDETQKVTEQNAQITLKMIEVYGQLKTKIAQSGLESSSEPMVEQSNISSPAVAPVETPRQPQIHLGGMMGHQPAGSAVSPTTPVADPVVQAPQPDLAQPETTLPQFSE